MASQVLAVRLRAIGEDQDSGGEDEAKELRERMGIVSKVGDYGFKVFSAALGLATVYLTATFSVNVYRGLAWHNAQSVLYLPLPLIPFTSCVSAVSLWYFDVISSLSTTLSGEYLDCMS